MLRLVDFLSTLDLDRDIRGELLDIPTTAADLGLTPKNVPSTAACLASVSGQAFWRMGPYGSPA